MCTGEMQDSIETANNIALSKFVKGYDRTVPLDMGAADHHAELDLALRHVLADASVAVAAAGGRQRQHLVYHLHRVLPATRPSEPQRWSAVHLK